MSTAFLLQPTYRFHITAHFHQKSINCDISLTFYYKICARQNMPPQMPWIRHMPKLLDMHLWGRYVNIHATYEANPIIDLARIAVHRWQCQCQMKKWWWCHSQVIYTELAILLKQAKKCHMMYPQITFYVIIFIGEWAWPRAPQQSYNNQNPF